MFIQFSESNKVYHQKNLQTLRRRLLLGRDFQANSRGKKGAKWPVFSTMAANIYQWVTGLEQTCSLQKKRVRVFVGVCFLVSLFCALNNVENELLQTFVYVCLSFEPYQLWSYKATGYRYTYIYVYELLASSLVCIRYISKCVHQAKINYKDLKANLSISWENSVW